MEAYRVQYEWVDSAGNKTEIVKSMVAATPARVMAEISQVCQTEIRPTFDNGCVILVNRIADETIELPGA